jgi:hypothetical protein
MAPNRSVGIQSIAFVNEVFSGMADPALPCLGLSASGLPLDVNL